MKLTKRQTKYLPIKRTIDVILSGGAIVVLSPVLLGISAAIKLDSKGPVLFKQKRVGKDKELFEIWKFRSMYTGTPKNLPTHILDNQDAHITYDFSGYDVVYHVAGIAYADVGKVTEEQKQLYYQVNTDLAVDTAEKVQEAGVKQFLFMSSMIVYSGCKEKMIHANTKPKPLNFYEDSKWQADQKIRELGDESFKVVVLRPPMIYGKGSKGNYPELAKLPVFPIVKNKWSMLHIDNLCQFVKLMIDHEGSGVFFPQNGEYTNTSDMSGYQENYRVNSLRKSIEVTER